MKPARTVPGPLATAGGMTSLPPMGRAVQRDLEGPSTPQAPASHPDTSNGIDLSSVPVHAASTLAASRHGNPWETQADAVGLEAMSSPASTAGVLDRVGQLMGADFSSVRIHRDSSQAEAADAHGMAQGADVHFAPGRFRPDLPLGRALIGHELAHVAQQGAVPSRSEEAPTPGLFRSQVSQLRTEHPGDRLRRSGHPLLDMTAGLAPPPLGMQQRCVAGCKSCSSEHDSKGDQAPSAKPAASAAPPQPQPTHSVGPSAEVAGVKVVRLAWTVDDGPTAYTPKMKAAAGPRASTWFIMSNQLGAGPARPTALTELVNKQAVGDEVAIHSMHPTISHSAWFPIALDGVNKGYTTTAAAMKDLVTFTDELRAAGLKVHFARMPGGEFSEVKKYVEDEHGPVATSDAVARALLAGTTPVTPAPATVATDVALVMSTLKKLQLHLWGGSSSGPEVTANTWEAESSGVSERTNDVVIRFKKLVAQLASGKRKTPASLVILAHDTTKPDTDQATANFKDMETYAAAKGVRVEYYRMEDLYTILRGSPP